jgi:superfamily II DNA or RNA helicase
MMSSVLAPSPLDRLLTSLDPRGREFEVLCQWFLRNDPEFAAEYAEVWLWREWPGRWGIDRGIDLVAHTFHGANHAVQAKHYAPANTVTKTDMDKFLSESNRAVIDSRLLIASTNRVSTSAQQVMAGQEKPVATCLLARMRASSVEWPASIAELAPAPAAKAEPREHQQEALEEIDRWVRGGGTRGQVIMPCGTGKSLVEIWAAERMAARHVLLLVPTIPLLRQSAREWHRHADTRRSVLRICSDKAPAGTEDVLRGDELGTLRTTDPAEIEERLRGDAPLLVLCTYDSSPTLAEAMQTIPGFAFDVAIADEAHRCAGLEGARSRTILDGEAIRAKRRLFFTATPTVYGRRDKSRAAKKNVKLASMDDRERFGRVVHHLSFAEAIRKKLLCPYQVAVIPIDDDEVHELIKRRRIVTADGEHKLEAARLATQIAVGRAMRRFGCKRVVAFHPSIAESKQFSTHFPIAVELLEDDERPETPVWSEHVDGDRMPFPRRAQLLEHFESDGEEHRLLSNVRLLTEGVDVPGIDGIAFVDTHRGHVSIIQAVGRAVRPAPGKTIGTIVLPVVLRKGESFDAALARSEHRSIVDVLGALRSHDADIIKSLDALRFSTGPDPHAGAALPGRFVIDAPQEVDEKFAAAVDVAIASALGVATARSPRRSPDVAPLLPPREPKPLSDQELFEIGIHKIGELGRWQLETRVPDEVVDSIPLGWCWREVKRRWAAGQLSELERKSVADSISWLAPDLQLLPAQRREMAALTDAELPDQIVAQCREGGLYASCLEPLSAVGTNTLVTGLTDIEKRLTHPAMSAEVRLRYMLPAALRLAEAVRDAGQASGLDSWEQQPWRDGALDGFVWILAAEQAKASGLELPSTPFSMKVTPEAVTIGVRSAEELAPLAARMSIYRFPGDVETVEGLREEELQMTARERLDPLGWEIYMLGRHRGEHNEDALRDAREQSVSLRRKIRQDLRLRSIREVNIRGVNE